MLQLLLLLLLLMLLLLLLLYVYVVSPLGMFSQTCSLSRHTNLPPFAAPSFSARGVHFADDVACLWASKTPRLGGGGGAQLVNEMLQGIRAIKFYNWETPFRQRVEAIHDEELDILRRSTTLRSLVVSVLTTTPAIVIVITLGLYRWEACLRACMLLLLWAAATPWLMFVSVNSVRLSFVCVISLIREFFFVCFRVFVCVVC